MRLTIGILLALTVVSCDTRTRPPGAKTPVSRPATQPDAGETVRADPPTPTPQSGGGQRWSAGGISWVVPDGWEQIAGSGMRFATLKSGDVELTVFKLVTSPVVDNINRWRGQIGLGPALPDELAKTTTKVSISGREGTVVDATGPSQRLLALILPVGQQSWFMKLMGETGKVSQQEAAFKGFVESIEIE